MRERHSIRIKPNEESEISTDVAPWPAKNFQGTFKKHLFIWNSNYVRLRMVYLSETDVKYSKHES